VEPVWLPDREFGPDTVLPGLLVPNRLTVQKELRVVRVGRPVLVGLPEVVDIVQCVLGGKRPPVAAEVRSSRRVYSATSRESARLHRSNQRGSNSTFSFSVPPPSYIRYVR
jgi:hypothetical protein